MIFYVAYLSVFCDIYCIMITDEKLRIAGIEQESFVDGPGIRFVVFTQGCTHHCPECHNPETHAFGKGQIETADSLLKMVDANPLLSGVTLSGGDPMEQAVQLLPFVRGVKMRQLNLVVFTGYRYEALMCRFAHPAMRELLTYTDILIDGPYMKDLRDLSLMFRGSSNQRIIDVPKSIVEGKVVIHDIQLAEMLMRSG